MERNRRSMTQSAVKAAIALALVFGLTTGCESVNRLREAQDAFSQAAAMENSVRLDGFRDAAPDAGESLAGLSSASAGYASVLLSLEQLDRKDQKYLRDNGLWGNVLTLKALSQWRLGNYPDALDTASKAEQEAADQLYPRDRALITALPGLIMTDQAYANIINAGPTQGMEQTERTKRLKEVEALLVGETGAVKTIAKARSKVGKAHPVQVYLIQAQLAAHRNLMVAYGRFHEGRVIPGAHPARDDSRRLVSELDELLRNTLKIPQGDTARIRKYWTDLLGL